MSAPDPIRANDYAAWTWTPGAGIDSLGLTRLPLLGYNGHLVCIQDRQENAPLPAFNTASSLHAVALNSIHAHGETLDWQELHAGAEHLMHGVANGQLQAPAKQFFDFAELPQALRRLKSGEGSGKWISRLPAPAVIA